jgi:hypothetical protein
LFDVSLAVAPFGAEPEVKVECCCIPDHVASLSIPSQFVDCVGGVEARDKVVEQTS